MWFDLLAQTAPVVQVQPTEPLSGWFSVVLQTGAFGLLTYLIVKVAPKFFKDAKDEREKRDAAFAAHILLLQTKFDERSQLVVAFMEKQRETMTSQLQQQTGQFSETLDRTAERFGHALERVCKADQDRK